MISRVDKRKACPFCGESRFRTAAQRSCHVSKNHAEFACTCFRRYTSKEELEEHQCEMTKNAKKYQCSRCCKSFQTQDALHQHQRTKRHWAQGERQKAQEVTGRHFCHDSCGRSFKTAKGLIDHILSARPDEYKNKCYDCLDRFAEKSHLDQHHKDTGHKNKTSPGDKSQLVKTYYDKKVKVGLAEKKDSVGLVSGLKDDLMSGVRKQPGGNIYSSDVKNAGSNAAKTKVGKPNEFDLNVPMAIRGVEEVTKGKKDYRYVPPVDKGHGVAPPNNMNVKRDIEDIPKYHQKEIKIGEGIIRTDDPKVPPHLTHNRQLIPHEVKRDLYGKLKKVIHDRGLQDKVHLSPLAHGPAITMTIKGEMDINVDVVPTIPSCVPVSNNGWPRPDTRRAFSETQIRDVLDAGLHYVAKGDTTWYNSYSKAETAMFKTLDSGNGCRKAVLKCMKKFVMDAASRSSDGLPGISSHLMKNQTLWSSEWHHEPGHWHERNLAERLIDTLGEFETALRTRKLPSYFNTSENILAGKDRAVLNNLADQMREERLRLVHM